MQRRYDTRPLLIREAFIVKYEAPGEEDSSSASLNTPRRQAGLGFHRDGTLLNCVIVLSAPSDYEGGGTIFATPLDKIYLLEQGDCLCSCGQFLHGAQPV